MQQSEMHASGPKRDRQRNGNEREAQKRKGRKRESEIAHQASQHGKMTSAQRVFPLQKEQEREKRNEDWASDVVEQLSRFHREFTLQLAELGVLHTFRAALIPARPLST